MRNVISGLFISLDGVVEAPDQWQVDDAFNDDAMDAAMMKVIGNQDDVLLGRVTYQEWVNYWPNVDDPQGYAGFINNVPKHVISSTLDHVEWSNSNLVKGDPIAAVSRLKQSPGRDIGVQGSPSLARSLLMNDQLDRLILVLVPVIVGRGRRLFDDWGELRRMKLVESQITPKGVALLTYEPHR